MTDSTNDLPVPQAVALLTRYGFDLRGTTAQEAIARWLQIYPAKWVRLAVVEALYLGRYKAKSVESILEIWLRRGQPRLNFSYEFERLIVTNPPEENNSVVERVYQHPESTFSPQPTVSQTVDFGQLLEEKIINPSTEAKLTTASREANLTADELTQKIQNISNPSMRSPSHQETSQQNFSNSQGAIDQFKPSRDNSEFYSKLKTVLQRGMREGETR
jgi:hypothetical protein